MALQTIQEHVEQLLTRRLVEDKAGGAPSAEIEAAAVLETVALNLFLEPRSALYFAILARNALDKAVSDEIDAVTAVIASVKDLGNQSYALKNLRPLERARTSLIQIEGQGQLSSTSGSFKNFESAVDDFLNNHLAKNVRRPEATDLVRPGVEAAVSLPDDVQALKALHDDVVTRLGYLASGIRAFSESIAANVIGLNTAYRIRQVVEEMMDELAADPQAAKSREYTLKLIAAKAALRTVGAPPSVLAPRIDVASGIKAKTLDAYAEVTSGPGPWLFGPGTFGAVNGSGTMFPPTGVELAGRPFIMGTAVGSPVLPANSDLYLCFGSVQVRVPVNETGAAQVTPLSAVAAAVNVAAGAYCEAGLGWAGQLVIVSKGVDVGVQATMVDDSGTSYSTSAAPAIGFGDFAYEASALARQPFFLAALNGTWFYAITAFGNSDGTITIKSVTPNQDLVVDLPSFGQRTVKPQTDRVRLYDGDGPRSAVGLVEVGDLFTLPDGQVREIRDIDEDGIITLDAQVAIFDGQVRVESPIVSFWTSLQRSLDGFLQRFSTSGFAEDLSKLDAIVAPLYGAPTPARRNDAVRALDSLRSWLDDLRLAISGNIPVGTAQREREVVEGIISTLKERKFDRALAFLLQCRIQDVFTMDWQTVSFGGELLAALTDVAQQDTAWPKAARDEGYAAVHSIEGPKETP